MEANGYVFLHRQIMDWEWWSDLKTSRLFETIIMLANHKKKSWMGIEVDRGQLITSQDSLAEKACLTRQSVRTALKRLISTGEITIKSTKHFSIITINRYNDFQSNWCSDPTIKSTNNLTHNQPRPNQCLTTNNNLKNIEESVCSIEAMLPSPPLQLDLEEPKSSKKQPRRNAKHRFHESPFFGPGEWREALNDWSPEVADYWHEELFNASEANEDLKYHYWPAAARQWRRREERKGRVQ